MTAIAITHKAEILDLIASGKRLNDIAPVYGISAQAISKVLTSDPEYHVAMESSFACRLDEAEDQIQRAIDQVDVSRARAYWGALSWRAERECSERWGKQPEVVIVAGSSIEPALEALSSAILDRVMTVAVQQTPEKIID